MACVRSIGYQNEANLEPRWNRQVLAVECACYRCDSGGTYSGMCVLPL